MSAIPKLQVGPIIWLHNMTECYTNLQNHSRVDSVSYTSASHMRRSVLQHNLEKETGIGEHIKQLSVFHKELSSANE